MEVTIDASEFNSLEEFHELLKEKLDFPDDYNDTLDELWNCIIKHTHLPLHLFWTDYETSESILGDDAKELIDLLNEADDEIDDFYFEIQV